MTLLIPLGLAPPVVSVPTGLCKISFPTHFYLRYCKRLELAVLLLIFLFVFATSSITTLIS